MSLYNQTDCSSIRNEAQSDMQKTAYLFYTYNGVLGLVLVVLVRPAYSVWYDCIVSSIFNVCENLIWVKIFLTYRSCLELSVVSVGSVA